MTVAMLPSLQLKPKTCSPADVLGHPSPIQLLCWIVAFPESDDSNEQCRAVLEGIQKLQGVQNEKCEAFRVSVPCHRSYFCLMSQFSANG